MNILVLDVGTSSMRGILYSEQGMERMMESRGYRAVYLPNGRVEQNALDWENAMTEILRAVSGRADAKGWSIDAVALTAQRSSVLPVDRKMRPLQPAIMWQDKRTTEICARMEKENPWVFSRCGSVVNPVFAGSKITWIKEYQPEIYDNAQKFMVIPDYLLYLLTGECKTDVTYGSRTLLMNLENKQWDEQLLELFGVGREKLLEITDTGEFGKLTREAAQRTGLQQGIPVISAGGDQQCGSIGQGVFLRGRTSVTAGTGGFIITACDKIPEGLSCDITCNCSSVRGQYILESGLLTCCSAFDWFLRNFYPGESFEKINREIAATPLGARDLICLPLFQGRGNPDWNNRARGMFANLSLSHEKNDFLRALVEGICYEFRNGLEVIQGYVNVENAALNGGLSNSVVFGQMLCDVLGIPVMRSAKAQATACGAFMIALHALDPDRSLEEIFDMMTEETQLGRFVPDQKNTVRYQEHLKCMNQWYRKLYG